MPPDDTHRIDPWWPQRCPELRASVRWNCQILDRIWVSSAEGAGMVASWKRIATTPGGQRRGHRVAALVLFHLRHDWKMGWRSFLLSPLIGCMAELSIELSSNGWCYISPDACIMVEWSIIHWWMWGQMHLHCNLVLWPTDSENSQCMPLDCRGPHPNREGVMVALLNFWREK